MKKTQAALTTHFKRLWVTVRPSYGNGPADASQFAAGQEYEVLATEVKAYEDGTTALCFLLANEKGDLQEVFATLCKLARKEDF